MSGREFRSFQEGRPDHERWELIRGVPVMMVPPTIAHQRIADNLTRLLNEALAKHDVKNRFLGVPGQGKVTLLDLEDLVLEGEMGAFIGAAQRLLSSIARFVRLLL